MKKVLKYAKFVVAAAGVAVTVIEEAYTNGGTNATIAISAVTAFLVWLVPNLKTIEGE